MFASEPLAWCATIPGTLARPFDGAEPQRFRPSFAAAIGAIHFGDFPERARRLRAYGERVVSIMMAACQPDALRQFCAETGYYRVCAQSKCACCGVL